MVVVGMVERRRALLGFCIRSQMREVFVSEAAQ